MTLTFCRHVYEEMEEDTCHLCGKPTHRIDWEKQSKLKKKWLKENPDAWREVGWWSI